MLEYFLYARKSSEEEERQVASIASQVSELQSLAKRRGIVVARVFEESQSARRPGRPVFSKMMREVERRPVAGILCWKADRLARNMVDGGLVIDVLDRERVEEIISPGRTFRNTSDDKLLLGIEFSMSKKFVDDLSENVKRGNRDVVSSGRCTGLVPLGYLKEAPLDRVRGRGAGRTVIDPVRFPLVQELFRRYLTGAWTVTELHAAARDELGLRTRGTRRHPAGPLGLSSLFATLQNPFYMGLIKHGKDLFKGDHEAIVTPREFERVQEIMRGRHARRPVRHNYTYTGLIRCATCGRAVTCEEHFNRQGHRYVYYRCSRRRIAPIICREPYLSEERIEEQLVEALSSFAVPEEYVRWIMAHLQTEDQKLLKTAKAARAGFEAELTRKDQEIDRLTTLCVHGTLSEDEYLRAKTKALAERLAIEARLADPASLAEAATRQLRETITFATEAPKAFREGTAAERRKLIATVAEKIVLHDRRIELQLHPIFAILAGQQADVLDETKLKDPNPRANEEERLIRAEEQDDAGRHAQEVGTRLRGRDPNPAPPPRISLHRRESPARGGARSVTYSRWCARVEDVRRYLMRQHGIAEEAVLSGKQPASGGAGV